MLKSISLENYKCFKDKTDIEIAPLTVLCGVNSSGKSSILKSLLMLKQTFEDTNTSDQMLFNGKYIDNGTFSEILCDQHSENFFTISNTFELKRSKETASKDNVQFRDLNRLYYRNDVEKFIINYCVSIDNSGASLYANKLHAIDVNIEVELKTGSINSRIELCRNGKKTYTVRGTQIPDVAGNLGDFNINNAICYFRNMTLNSIYEERMNPSTKLFIPTLTSIFSILPSQYIQLQYIAPLRENPMRRYIADKKVVDVGVSGEDTPLLLKNKQKNTVVGVMAPESEDNYVPSQTVCESNKFIDLIGSWMQYLELGTLFLDNRQQDLVKVRINKHNLVDVGFGISQSLPILAEGIIMSSNQTLILEQPEIHLHPKMQMRMADFLLSLSTHDKSVVIETHSDHFVNRIVRRYMEDVEVRDKIQIYFVDQNELGMSFITPIVIDEVDGALCENENFFYQFSNETAKIIDVGYRNLQKQES